jgi:hypothetical protein
MLGLLVVLLLLAACDRPAPTPSGREITRADHGQTVELQVGERFLLKLGEDYDWTVTVADTQAVSRVINITVVRGAQGVYEAKRTGQTTLSAVGDPPCLKSEPPCKAPSVSFEVTLVVR